MKNYSNTNYSFIYDSTWQFFDIQDQQVELKHDNDGTLKIEYITLNNENKYLALSDLIDDYTYKINSNNPDYKLLLRNSVTATSKNLDGYQLLYENQTGQVMMVICKQSDKLIIFTFTASNECFDILLDSANSIINNFTLCILLTIIAKKGGK